MSSAAAAFGWGLLAASSLVLGALLVLVRPLSSRVLGLIMGFGAGVLMSAVSFELVEEAVDTSERLASVSAGLAAGALVFFTGDTLIARIGRTRPGPAAHTAVGAASRAGSAAMPIVLGTVLDGVPESAVLGLTLLETGSIGVSMLVAVLVSNLPEAVAASSDLLEDGWPRGRVVGLWCLVALVSALAAMAGYALLDGASTGTIAFMFSFAGGAILAMLSTSMIPEAYERAGRPVGLLVTAGFAVSFAITWASA